MDLVVTAPEGIDATLATADDEAKPTRDPEQIHKRRKSMTGRPTIGYGPCGPTIGYSGDGDNNHPGYPAPHGPSH